METYLEHLETRIKELYSKMGRTHQIIVDKNLACEPLHDIKPYLNYWDSLEAEIETLILIKETLY